MVRIWGCFGLPGAPLAELVVPKRLRKELMILRASRESNLSSLESRAATLTKPRRRPNKPELLQNFKLKSNSSNKGLMLKNVIYWTFPTDYVLKLNGWVRFNLKCLKQKRV